MTFELGRARFIIEADNQKVLQSTAQTFNAITNAAQSAAKAIAEQNDVQVRSVYAASALIIDAEKKAAAEAVRIAKEQAAAIAAAEKAAAADRKRTTQELTKYNQQQFKEDLANWKSVLKERDAANAQAANEAKARTQAMLRYNMQAYKEEEAARKKAEQDAARSQGSGLFGTGISGARVGATAATLLGFGAIASGAVVAREAMLGLTEATLKQEQAQRSLSAAFGTTAENMKKAADAQANAFNKSNTTVEQGTALFGILNKQYGLTGAQIEALIPTAIKLQKAFGGDLLEVFRNVSDAIQGEPQALEKYGIALQQNAVVISTYLTPAEKKLYETMTAREQAQIRWRILQQEAAKINASAVTDVDKLTVALDKLHKAWENITKIASQAIAPELKGVADFITDKIDKAAEHWRKIQEESAAIVELRRQNPDFNPASPEGQAQLEAQKKLNAERQKAIEDTKKLYDTRIQADKDLQAAEENRVDSENAQVARRAEILEREATRAAKAELERIEAQKKAAERAQEVELRNSKDRYDAVVKALNEQEYVRKQASEAELARINKEKDEAVKAADERRDADLERINVAKAAAQNAAQEQIRQLEIQRDKALKAAETRKDTELKRLEAEKEARDHVRTQEDRDVADSIEKQQRMLEDAHKKNVRRLEDEADAERDKSEQAIRNLERQASREDERHRKKLQQIDDESKAQLDAIDAQIRAIDDAQRALENARRTSDLQSKVSEAQVALSQAQGRGTPQQLLDARSKLTNAIRINDPEAVRKAQAELTEISGKGTQAILEAQKNLARAEQDLRDEGVKETADANKQKLEDQKRSIQEGADAEKRAEDDRNRRRKDSLDKDKQAAKDRLDDALKKIDERKKKEADAYEADKRGAADAAETAKRKLEDRRTAEDEAHKHAIEQVNERYNTEKDQIRDTYDGEERGYIPAIKRALDRTIEMFGQQTTEVQNRYKAERDQIYQTYDDPVNGLIARHKAAEEAAVHEHQIALQKAQEHYEEEQRQIKQTYRNDDGVSGILDRLDHLALDTKNALDDVTQKFRDYKDGLVGENGVLTLTWKEATAQAEAFFKYLESRGGFKVNPRVIDTSTTRAGPDLDIPSRVTGGGSGGNGEALPPATVPAESTGAGPTPPVKIPPQINQYSLFKDSTQLIKDSSCGPAAIDWISTMAGHPLSPQEALNIAAAAGWTARDGMGGPSAFSNALSSLGIKNKLIYGPNLPELIDQYARRGIPFAMSTREHYYQVSGGSNAGLNVGGSGEALIGGSSVMSLSKILSRKDSVLQAIIVPDINARDAGYLFKNPTLYRDLRTGEHGILAEQGPERLLGRKQTQLFEKIAGGIINTNPLSGAQVRVDPSVIGAAFSGAVTRDVTNNTSRGGDNFTYYGVAPEDIMSKFRDEQRRTRVLRGGGW